MPTLAPERQQREGGTRSFERERAKRATVEDPEALADTLLQKVEAEEDPFAALDDAFRGMAQDLKNDFGKKGERAQETLISAPEDPMAAEEMGAELRAILEQAGRAVDTAATAEDPMAMDVDLDAMFAGQYAKAQATQKERAEIDALKSEIEDQSIFEPAMKEAMAKGEEEGAAAARRGDIAREMQALGDEDILGKKLQGDIERGLAEATEEGERQAIKREWNALGAEEPENPFAAANADLDALFKAPLPKNTGPKKPEGYDDDPFADIGKNLAA